jgi:hypothetical protein
MQAPVIIFDHVAREVITIDGRKAEKRLAEIIESQRTQIATSGRPSK